MKTLFRDAKRGQANWSRTNKKEKREIIKHEAIGFGLIAILCVIPWIVG